MIATTATTIPTAKPAAITGNDDFLSHGKKHACFYVTVLPDSSSEAFSSAVFDTQNNQIQETFQKRFAKVPSHSITLRSGSVCHERIDTTAFIVKKKTRADFFQAKKVKNWQRLHDNIFIILEYCHNYLTCSRNF